MQVTVAKYIFILLVNDVNQPHNYTKRDDIRIKMQAIISLFIIYCVTESRYHDFYINSHTIKGQKHLVNITQYLRFMHT